MSADNQPSDTFVTQADLSTSRPSPGSSDSFSVIALLRNPAFQRLVAAAFFMFVALNLNTILQSEAWTDFRTATIWRDIQATFSNIGITVAIERNVADGLLFAAIIAVPALIIALGQGLIAQSRTGVPILRNLDFIRNIIQVIFLFLLVVTGYTLSQNLQDNLAQSGLRINFEVLGRAFGTEVTEGPDPSQELTFLSSIPVIGQILDDWTWLDEGTTFRALSVGLVNTLRVVALSLIFATITGVLVGIGLLSNNWLVRNISSIYTEIFRNTPLLVQLFFIYKGLLGVLPRNPADATEIIPGAVYLSGRGLNYPSLNPTDTAAFFMIPLLIGIGVGIYLWRQRLQISEETGEPAHTLRYFSISVLAFAGAGLLLAVILGGLPYSLELPELSRFNFDGGARFSAEYLGLFLGLVFYTSAFIADIVRAGIQSVPYGQIEAARAAGLTSAQTLRLIILPQALRLIVPPMTNQYLNLAKNSSLGIAIGFYDVYNVATIASNQTGQAVALFVVLMVTYLMLSLVISLFMNVFNRSLRLQTR